MVTRVGYQTVEVLPGKPYDYSKSFGEESELKITFPDGAVEEKCCLIIKVTLVFSSLNTLKKLINNSRRKHKRFRLLISILYIGLRILIRIKSHINWPLILYLLFKIHLVYSLWCIYQELFRWVKISESVWTVPLLDPQLAKLTAMRCSLSPVIEHLYRPGGLVTWRYASPVFISHLDKTECFVIFIDTDMFLLSTQLLPICICIYIYIYIYMFC